ncbi:hypothetical protein PF004_g30759, partial [Phytophthora fragariae]
ELLALGDDDFLETVPVAEAAVTEVEPRTNQTPVSTAYSLASSKHQLMVSTDKTAKGKFKFRVCKVCSVLRGAGSPGSNRPPGTTRHYCKQCSTDRGRLFLCSKARHVSDGNSVSCFNIWHSKWKNGDQLPHSEKVGRIRMRRSKEELRAETMDTASSDAELPRQYETDVQNADGAASVSSSQLPVPSVTRNVEVQVHQPERPGADAAGQDEEGVTATERPPDESEQEAVAEVLAELLGAVDVRSAGPSSRMSRIIRCHCEVDLDKIRL